MRLGGTLGFLGVKNEMALYNCNVSFQRNPWMPYIGDCQALTTYLDSKSGWQWLPLKFLSALFRGISQVKISVCCHIFHDAFRKCYLLTNAKLIYR